MNRLLLLIAAIFIPSTAFGMHISDGILPIAQAGAWYMLLIPFIAYGLFRMKKSGGEDLSFKPLLGLTASVVFIISAMPIPIPIAGTCSHPSGTGISGVLLGPGISVLVAMVALLMQVLFLGHGGLSTLGANTLSMGVAGSFAGYIAFKISRKAGLGAFASGFAAGVAADWATYFTTSLQLSIGLHGAEGVWPFALKVFAAFLPTQIPIGILEGFATGGMISLLMKKRPDILARLSVIPAKEAVR